MGLSLRMLTCIQSISLALTILKALSHPSGWWHERDRPFYQPIKYSIVADLARFCSVLRHLHIASLLVMDLKLQITRVKRDSAGRARWVSEK